MVARWRKKFLAEYMSLDSKPRGKWRRPIEGSVREEAKREIRHELDRDHDAEALQLFLWDEEERAYACYLNGGCESCGYDDDE